MSALAPNDMHYHQPSIFTFVSWWDIFVMKLISSSLIYWLQTGLCCPQCSYFHPYCASGTPPHFLTTSWTLVPSSLAPPLPVILSFTVNSLVITGSTQTHFISVVETYSCCKRVIDSYLYSTFLVYPLLKALLQHLSHSNIQTGCQLHQKWYGASYPNHQPAGALWVLVSG